MSSKKKLSQERFQQIIEGMVICEVTVHIASNRVHHRVWICEVMQCNQLDILEFQVIKSKMTSYRLRLG